MTAALATTDSRKRDSSDHMAAALHSAWLEVTGRCQLSCVHCYAESGPHGNHGTMSTSDWHGVITELRLLGAAHVQFIGGEPTLHPNLPDFVRAAVSVGFEAVEVFSNFQRISAELWNVFSLPGVQLATSYYSPCESEHDLVTNKTGSHRRTLRNIQVALEREIPLRVSVIDMNGTQATGAAVAEMCELGVADVQVDRLREVGRGVRGAGPTLDELCGNCGQARIAIASDGQVWPCVLARWIPLGNVRENSLSQIWSADSTRATVSSLTGFFTDRGLLASGTYECGPNCGPSTGCPGR
jgi:MoaA/NifB/PqqE/SkfB family radical SAM enzyme